MSKNVKGLEKLIRTLDKIPNDLDSSVSSVVQANAKEIELEAKRLAPVGTPESTGIKGYIGGSLRQSIKAKKVNKKTYSIQANSTGLAPYAKFVEFGTYKMKAQPFLYPAFFKQRPRFIKDLESLLKKTFK